MLSLKVTLSRHGFGVVLKDTLMDLLRPSNNRTASLSPILQSTFRYQCSAMRLHCS